MVETEYLFTEFANYKIILQVILLLYNICKPVRYIYIKLCHLISVFPHSFILDKYIFIIFLYIVYIYIYNSFINDYNEDSINQLY